MSSITILFISAAWLCILSYSPVATLACCGIKYFPGVAAVKQAQRRSAATAAPCRDLRAQLPGPDYARLDYARHLLLCIAIVEAPISVGAMRPLFSTCLAASVVEAFLSRPPT